MKNTVFRICFWLCILAVASTRLRAAGETGQVTFATVPVPGATVIASRGDKKIVTSTDAQGVYRFPDLADGTWTIDVEMLGFEPVTQEATVAADGAPVNITLKLMPFGSVSGTIKPIAPVAAAPGAPATTARAATPTAAAVASPSAANRTNPPPAPAGGQAAGAPGSAASAGNPELNGDGLVVNGSVNNGAASPFAQLAAFGNNRRGGRSLYNWSIASVLGSSALDARQFSLLGTDVAKPSYTDAQVQGTFGGPIKIPGLTNKPQITLTYLHRADHNVTTQSALVPTLLERSGNFSQSVVQIVNPATGLPFANNAIPSGSISPQAAALLALYPAPNATGTTFNYQAPILATTGVDSFQLRLSDAINNKNQVFGTFSYTRTTTKNDNIFAFTDANRLSVVDGTINWSHRFSPFSNLRAGYHFSESIIDNTPYFANRDNISGNAGISGNDQNPVNWGPPSLSFGSIASLSSGSYASNHDIAHAFTAEATWSHARHNFTYGGGVSARKLNVFSQQNARGSLSFTGTSSGSDIADFLLGLPHSSSIAFGNPDKFLRAPTYNLYVTDDWRISPTFTANVGVRWEYEAPMTERDGRLVNLDVAPGFTSAAPVLASNPTGSITGTHYSKSLVNPDRSGIQPRVAFAWRPIAGSSVVVRGGYGIYRNTAVYQSIASLLDQQPPLSTASSVSSTATNQLTLANPFGTPVGVANTFAVDPNLRVGSSHTWQLSLQRDLPASLTMNVTYLGTRGVHLMQEFLPNTYPIGAVNPCPTCPAGFVYLTSGGHSLRNAGQFQLRRRLRNGFTATVQYTLAKATDNATAFSGASLGGSSIAQNWLDLSAEQAPSNFDQRHQVTAQVQYTTGQGVGGGAMLTGVKGALFKGWTFTSNITVGSGLPFTPVYFTTVPGTGVIGSIRASTTGVSTAPVADGTYLNPAAYSVPAPGQWGTAGRNSVRGPSQFTLDGQFGRSFLLGERLTLDMRFDALNLLNRLVYSSVTANVTNPGFGVASQAGQSRKIQLVSRLRF